MKDRIIGLELANADTRKTGGSLRKQALKKQFWPHNNHMICKG
jgi:hypothetical protein